VKVPSDSPSTIIRYKSSATIHTFCSFSHILS
jgi:hypothetical protein